MELFHKKSSDKKGDEVVICGNVNNFDKIFKEYKTTKKTWDFGRFPFGRDFRYGWNPNGSTEISLECPVPGCKFGGFAKNFD